MKELLSAYESSGRADEVIHYVLDDFFKRFFYFRNAISFWLHSAATVSILLMYLGVSPPPGLVQIGRK